MGHGRAVDILGHFKDALSKVGESRLIQISMDGPNVNWSFYQSYVTNRKDTDKEAPKLLCLGSCGLHSIHGAFETGAQSTDWNVDGFLRGSHRIFKDSPARRADYTEVTGSIMFPLPFCFTRWVEDVPVSARAILILKDLRKWVNHVKSLPPSKIPKSVSFSNVQNGCDDILMECKLIFFNFVGRLVKPFLEKYQTQAPMVPFLSKDLENLHNTLMSLFMKPEAVKKYGTAAKMAKLDGKELDKHLLSARKTNIGFETSQKLERALANKRISELDALKFRGDCQLFLKSMTSKLLEKSPLKYDIVRHASSLDPAKVKDLDAPDIFRDLLFVLQNAKLRDGPDCDLLLQQYRSFGQEIPHYEKSMRLDKFYYGCLANRPEYTLLWKVVLLVLTLSHGQADVERSFSVNADMEVENLDSETLIALKRVHNGISHMKSYTDFDVPKELLASCAGARTRCQQSEEAKRQQENSNEKQKKRKALETDLADQQWKKTCFEATIKDLEVQFSIISYKILC